MKLGHGLMRCRSEFSFLVLVFCLFGVNVKLRPGLMRCRSENSFLVFVFCFFGVDVNLRHRFMRCRSESFISCGSILFIRSRCEVCT